MKNKETISAENQVIISCKTGQLGLHSRPTSKLIQLFENLRNREQVQIYLDDGEETIIADSIFEILPKAIINGRDFKLIIEGENAEKASQEILTCLRSMDKNEIQKVNIIQNDIQEQIQEVALVE